MSELQSFFASDSEYSEDEAQTSADLPRRVADAAAAGDINTIRRWLAAGGSPDAVLLWGEGTGIATPSSRRRADGVEDEAMIQHERAVKV